MKFYSLFILIFAFSSVTKAELKKSQLEMRHQILIEYAVIEKCQMLRGYIEEIKTIATPIKVDNGTTDYKYETLLVVHNRVDQQMEDLYEVNVKSSYSNTYDQETKNWGSYKIEAVSNCIQI